MPFLQEFLRTYLFLIPLVVLVLSEITKIGIELLFEKKWRRPFQQGGLPSTHSAVVTSLLIVVGRKLGIESVEFAICAVVAGIVWFDAFAIRGVVERHSRILNLIQSRYKFVEDVGHSFVEVLAGITFGAVVTLIGIWIS